ncbi:hypothetical protein KL918_000628 [Ogataea parapolymorpha]|uniref:Uncharacterized protein n=1 Tax=Ogataea parapolymorpha (strain ATCC 26012 / BCRC 20466 / JCM 22074 / NRRL Y-7560 / DL-1) TaxID=871575 RepID=W1QBB8_OGAPD|nr:hypothetical protein HPODL_01128 [Ogataea parapolymorpha DL-1]ESW97017.1 hypothetical protein HPODL_01128 [Ogataea parapolymorpha DL-1]KAG7869083.1 hypothetical protein KL918_000628 [Ogataea parapolymorpha]KAG7875867.1 hypothetical protein KL916_000538 [Ogataea parapolymorpha]
MSDGNESSKQPSAVDDAVASTNLPVAISPPLPARHQGHATGTSVHASDDHTGDHPPALPHRPPRSKKYGLDRVSTDDFELTTPIGSPRVPKQGAHSRSPADPASDTRSLHQKTLDFLLENQTSRIVGLFYELPEDLKIPDSEYYTQLNAQDHLIEVRSEVEAKNFNNPDQLTVYKLWLKSIKLKKFGVVTASNPELLAQLESAQIETESIFPQLASVCGKLGTKSLPPLVLLIHSRLQDPEITFILAKLYSKIDMTRWVFMVLRSVERTNASMLITWHQKHGDVAEFVQKQLESAKFWKQLTAQELDLVTHRVVVYGFDSIVGDVASMLCGGRPKRGIESHLIWDDHEYELLNEPLKEPHDLLREQNKLHKLQVELETKRKQYTELLNNYKQLNEERFSNQTMIKKLEANNGQLRLKRNECERKLNAQLSNFEVIKVNNEKNAEIDKMNQKLRLDIDRVQTELAELRAKKLRH